MERKKKGDDLQAMIMACSNSHDYQDLSKAIY